MKIWEKLRMMDWEVLEGIMFNFKSIAGTILL